MRTNLFLVVGIFCLFASISFSAQLCYYQGPDTFKSVSMSGFSVSGPQQPEEGDSVTVTYALQNIDPMQRILMFTQSKGTYVGASTPSGTEELGKTNLGYQLGPGQSISVQTTVLLDQAGAWKLWPAFCYLLDQNEYCSQAEWHACQLSVTEPDADGDGIPDQQDQCPNEAETFNDYQDDDGCPDSVPDTTGPSLKIRVTPQIPMANETFTVRVTAEDPSGISSIKILVNGQLAESCIKSPCEYTGTTPVDDPWIGASATDRLDHLSNAGDIPAEVTRGCFDSDDGDYPFVGGYATNETTRIEEGTIYLPTMYYDTCVNDTYIREYYCDGSSVAESVYNCHSPCYHAPEMLVEGGVSVQVAGDSCICGDSDYGKNYYVAGTTTGRHRMETDYCIGAISVMEYYCDESGAPASERYECEGWCSDGACECTDSDNGRNYSSFGRYGDLNETCIPEGRNGTLLEYYAEVNRYPNGTYYCDLRSELYDCPGYCYHGRCIDTCADGIQNQDETGVDCGGICPPCASDSSCMTGTKYAPDDTPCTLTWPDDPYKIVSWEEGKFDYLCNANEVCHPELDYIIEEASVCCTSAGYAAPDDLCREARRSTGWADPVSGAKRCRGAYIIKGLGRHANWMQHYYDAETCCSGWGICPNRSYFGTCDYGIGIFDPDANSLVCNHTSSENNQYLGWGSDTDMSLNTCLVWLRPAHASINIIKTGICRDYSLAVNTLLRKAGYAYDEVIGFCDGGHCYNLVKFPGDAQYTIVDTTGNTQDYDTAGGPPGGHPYCHAFNRVNWCLTDIGKTYLGTNCTGAETFNVTGTPRVCGTETYNGQPNYLCGSNDYGLLPIPEIWEIKSCNAGS